MFLSRLLNRLGIKQSRGRKSQPARRLARLNLEDLEERCVPTTGLSSIQSNFNGTAVPAGDSVWFSSVFKASGLGSGPVTVHVTNQEIDFAANGTNYAVNVPDANITFDPTATKASTQFDGSAWDTTLPMKFSGNGFLSGMALAVPNGLPGGINPVTWHAQFSSDTAGVTVNWQWAAAVYKPAANFGDYSGLQVKPVDDPNVSPYGGSDHAGTPEAVKSYVTGGTRGGGGSNYTGSYSSTASVAIPFVVPPQSASLSGTVYNATQGGTLANVTLTLSELVNGQLVVIATTTTGTDGSFSFTGLPPGIYTLTQTPPPPPSGLVETTDSSPGTVNGTTTDGSANGNTISGINLQSGNNAFNYNFSDMFAGS